MIQIHLILILLPDTKLYMWAIVDIYLISLLLADYSLLWK